MTRDPSPADPVRLRIAVMTPVLGIPSEIWIERQCRYFKRVEPVLMGWTLYPGWTPDQRVEVRTIPGRFGTPRTLLRRLMGRLGLARSGTLPAAQRQALRAALDAADVEAVLCHFAWTGMVVAQSLPRDMPLILHVHGRDVSSLLAGSAYRAGMRRLLRRADALIAVGRHQLDVLAPYGLPARSKVIPCGAPLDLFASAPLPRQSAEGPLRFLSVGRFSPEKGMFESLRAFERMASDFPEAELVLIGFGPEFDSLQKAAAQSPFAARIRLTGRLSQEEIARELSAAHVYLQHSREVGGWVEGFGVTLTEAGAAGLPLIASASGGLRDQVEEGKNGFLFPQGDIAAQADLMRRLASDPELRARLGATARDMARRFDAPLMARALEEEILDLIALRKRDGTHGR